MLDLLMILSYDSVTGRYYHKQPKVNFNCPQELYTLYEMSNPRIPPFISLEIHQDQTRSTKSKTSTLRIDNNKLCKCHNRISKDHW